METGHSLRFPKKKTGIFSWNAKEGLFLKHPSYNIELRSEGNEGEDSEEVKGAKHNFVLFAGSECFSVILHRKMPGLPSLCKSVFFILDCFVFMYFLYKFAHKKVKRKK